MDSQHRHELKENDLVEFLTHFGQWWGKHGGKILTVVLVLAVVVTGKRWFDASTAAATEKAWRDLADTTSPEGYRSVALSHQDPAVRALAYLRGADLLLAKSATASDDQHTTNDSTTAGSSQDLDSAALMYQQVVDDQDVHPAYRLNALLGLAAVAEGRRDWDQARNLYLQVTEQATVHYGAIAERAQSRAKMLDRLKKPVVFAPDPVVIPSTSELSPIDVPTDLDLLDGQAPLGQ